MESPPPRELWLTALGQIQLEVTRHGFDTWFRDTVGLDLRDGRFTIGVPSTFVAEYLERRMRPLVHKTLRGLAGQDLCVSFEIRQQADGAVPAAPAASPSRVRAHGKTAGPLNPRYTFDAFVVGKSNRFAHAAAIAVSENPGAAYNPLVIHAGVGLGKTHLLHAIGRVVQGKGLTVLYASAEQFTNDFVSALRESCVEDFRAKYRSIDVLLMDDIQFIAGKEHSRESFFHTFNDLHTASKQIVITTDTRPKMIPLLEERLSSRLEAGLTADILPPDLETRMAIVGKKAAEDSIDLPGPVTDFLARRFVRNVRELEGALNRIIAMARLTGRPVDMELANQAIADLTTGPVRTRRYTPGQILSATADYYGLQQSDITGASRKKGIVLGRQVAAYLLREDTERSLTDIGSILGDRGHTTALRSHAKIASEINLNAGLRRQVTELRELIDRDALRQA